MACSIFSVAKLMPVSYRNFSEIVKRPNAKHTKRLELVF